MFEALDSLSLCTSAMAMVVSESSSFASESSQLRRETAREGSEEGDACIDSGTGADEEGGGGIGGLGSSFISSAASCRSRSKRIAREEVVTTPVPGEVDASEVAMSTVPSISIGVDESEIIVGGNVRPTLSMKWTDV